MEASIQKWKIHKNGINSWQFYLSLNVNNRIISVEKPLTATNQLSTVLPASLTQKREGNSVSVVLQISLQNVSLLCLLLLPSFLLLADFFCPLEPTFTMLQLFFTVAFSVVPLTLYLPPVRSLNLFVETMEDYARESTTYTRRLNPQARFVWSRILDCMLCNWRLDQSQSGPGLYKWEQLFSLAQFLFFSCSLCSSHELAFFTSLLLPVLSGFCCCCRPMVFFQCYQLLPVQKCQCMSCKSFLHRLVKSSAFCYIELV